MQGCVASEMRGTGCLVLFAAERSLWVLFLIKTIRLKMVYGLLELDLVLIVWEIMSWERTMLAPRLPSSSQVVAA